MDSKGFTCSLEQMLSKKKQPDSTTEHNVQADPQASPCFLTPLPPRLPYRMYSSKDITGSSRLTAELTVWRQAMRRHISYTVDGQRLSQLSSFLRRRPPLPCSAWLYCDGFMEYAHNSIQLFSLRKKNYFTIVGTTVAMCNLFSKIWFGQE